MLLIIALSVFNFISEQLTRYLRDYMEGKKRMALVCNFHFQYWFSPNQVCYLMTQKYIVWPMLTFHFGSISTKISLLFSSPDFDSETRRRWLSWYILLVKTSFTLHAYQVNFSALYHSNFKFLIYIIWFACV